MDQVHLGNKRPRLGMAKLVHCPAYRGILETPLALSSGHVLLDCMAVEGISIDMHNPLNILALTGSRIREGISEFLRSCEEAGRSRSSTMYLYVHGRNPDGKVIDAKEHLRRGTSLDNLVKMWLYTWGQEEVD